jgi:hypothetical protein
VIHFSFATYTKKGAFVIRRGSDKKVCLEEREKERGHLPQKGWEIPRKLAVWAKNLPKHSKERRKRKLPGVSWRLSGLMKFERLGGCS